MNPVLPSTRRSQYPHADERHERAIRRGDRDDTNANAMPASTPVIEVARSSWPSNVLATLSPSPVVRTTTSHAGRGSAHAHRVFARSAAFGRRWRIIAITIGANTIAL